MKEKGAWKFEGRGASRRRISLKLLFVHYSRPLSTCTQCISEAASPYSLREVHLAGELMNTSASTSVNNREEHPARE